MGRSYFFPRGNQIFPHFCPHGKLIAFHFGYLLLPVNFILNLKKRKKKTTDFEGNLKPCVIA